MQVRPCTSVHDDYFLIISFSQIADRVIHILEECFEKGENYQSKLVAWIDRVFGREEERRSIKEIYEKVRKYFKDLNIELKEKFVNFGEYVKEQYQRVLDQSKSRVENVKKIAREVRMLLNINQGSGKELL